MISLVVNGKRHALNVSPDTMLLYVLRNDLGLNGPKFGCGSGQCGAWTVIMDGTAIRSCVTPVKRAAGRKTGGIAVTRLVAATDGQIINPKGLEMQMEGGIIQSASWTLEQAVAFDRRQVTSRDWASYPLLTFPNIPQCEIHLLNRPEEKPLGSGEASTGPAGAAIANAVSNALGRRIRDLIWWTAICLFYRSGSGSKQP